MPGVPQSVVLVPLPALDPVIGDLRRAHDPAAADDIPSHVTLNFPFVPPDQITREVRERLSDIADECHEFFVEFPEIGYFENAGTYIVHLRAEPADVFKRLSARILTDWPEYPLFGGNVAFDDLIPHVTIGYGDADFLEAVRAEIGPQLPLTARASGLALLTGVIGERWAVKHAAAFR